MQPQSAGLLLFRRTGSEVEFFLAHPGGPFWAKRDAGAWTIPKGTIESGESAIETAVREFREETGLTPQPPFLPLGTIRQRGGKVVQAWAWEGDADPASVRCSLIKFEWPRGSGRTMEFPEIDRCNWFALAEAKSKINVAQIAFLERLLEQL